MSNTQSPEWENYRGTQAANGMFDHLARAGVTEKEFKIVEGSCCFTMSVKIEKNNLCAKTQVLKGKL